MTCYIQTNNPEKVIKIESGNVELVENTLSPHDFNLVNVVKNSLMKEARALAKAEGVRLHKPHLMAAR